MARCAEWRREGSGLPPDLADAATHAAVRMTVEDWGRVTAEDRGWLAFVDGVLCYWSPRTEFGFRRGGREGALIPRGLRVDLEAGRRVVFHLAGPAGQRVLSDGYREWLASGGSEHDVLPPSAPRGVLSPRSRRALLCWLTGAVVLTAICIVGPRLGEWLMSQGYDAFLWGTTGIVAFALGLNRLLSRRPRIGG